jgi:hypothetical protein
MGETVRGIGVVRVRENLSRAKPPRRKENRIIATEYTEKNITIAQAYKNNLVIPAHDCMDAGVRAMHGAIAEAGIQSLSIQLK